MDVHVTMRHVTSLGRISGLVGVFASILAWGFSASFAKSREAFL